jgi:hypothetical protein
MGCCGNLDYMMASASRGKGFFMENGEARTFLMTVMRILQHSRTYERIQTKRVPL